MRFHIPFEMYMNLVSNKVILFTDSEDISTFLRPSILWTSQAWDKKSILSQALEIARSGYLCFHILAQAQGLSFMMYEYSRHRKGDVCYQPHLPTNILSLTLSRHNENTLRLSYCWNNGWLSVLILALTPVFGGFCRWFWLGFFVQQKVD